MSRKKKRTSGFTLIELIIVMSIMAILISIAVPNFKVSIRQAREAVLKQNLFTMRDLISRYTLDKQKPPQSLDDLSSSGYMKDIPKDPITGTADWQVEQCAEDETMSADAQDTGGICDVHSASPQISTHGDAYSSW